MFWITGDASLNLNEYTGNVIDPDIGAGDFMGILDNRGNITKPTIITTNGTLNTFTIEQFVNFLFEYSPRLPHLVNINPWLTEVIHEPYRLFGKFFNEREIRQIVLKVRLIQQRRPYSRTTITATKKI